MAANDQPGTSGAEPCRIDRQGVGLVLRLNRPAVRNALNTRCWRAIERAVDEAEADPDIRALIITGTEDVFSSGGDMKNVEGRGSGPLRDAARLRTLHRVLTRIAGADIPVLAAVEGPAVGVAWGLALTCDYVIASESASFMAPFGLRGLVPDGGTAFHFVRSLGRLRATRLLFSSTTLGAAEAAGLGLVTEVTPNGKALDRALGIAEELAATPRATLELTKRLLRRAESTAYREFLDTEFELAALNLQNPSLAQSRTSFTKARSA